MKLLLLACVVAAATAFSAERMVNDDEFIASLNSHNDMAWTAGKNEFFDGMTIGEAAMLLGADNDEFPEDMPTWTYPENPNLPTEFDGRKEYGQCTTPIRNQGHCGSCWAHSASEAMTVRTCLATQGKINEPLSPQDLVSCDHSDAGCHGGSGPSSTNFLVHHGLRTDACVKYVSGDGHVPRCTGACDDGSAPVRHYAANMRHISSDVNSIATEITKGPCYIRFDVYEDFMNYKSGVYHHLSGRHLGGHAVKPTGFGSENGVDYWLIGNSWGTAWGDAGYFKIKKGVNECGIEGGMVCFDYSHSQ